MIKLITSNQNLCSLRQSRDLIYLFAGRPYHYSTVSYSVCALLAPQSALLHRTIRIVPEERHDRRSSGTIRRAPVALKSADRSAGHVPALLRAPHCTWYLNGFPNGSNNGSTVQCRGEAHRYTVRYTYINHHAQPPVITQHTHCM